MQKRKKFVIRILIVSPLVLLLAQCSIGNVLPVMIGKKIWLVNDPGTLREEVRRNVLVGSSITNAKWILELNGFECSYTKEPIDVWDIKRTSKDEYYLSCGQSQSYIVCNITYVSTVRYINDKVTSVEASTSSYCL